jgi:hypothetical protein
MAFAPVAARSGQAETYHVELTTEESLGIARAAEPVSGGVPLPPGTFESDQSFTLLDDDGNEIPCQTSPLVVDADGTLRWVLLDFQDDVAAGETNRYMLRSGRSSAKATTRLKVDDNGQSVSVDTGKIAITLDKTKPFGLFDSVTRGGKPVISGGQVSYVQMQGRKGWDDTSKWQPRTLIAGVPESVKLCYAGPLRVTIEVAGRFADDPLGASYKAWITAWAGTSRIHVKYKICNSNPDRYTVILVNRSIVELELADRQGQVLLGANKPLTVTGDAWLHQGLLLHHTYQDIAGAVTAGSGGRTIWTGNGPQDKPSGWMALGGPSGLFVCDRLLASNPARRLAVAGNKLILEGIAERFEGPKDKKFQRDRRIGQPWSSEGFWLFDCSHHCSEYLFDFAAPSEPEQLDDLSRASRNRLWVLAPGEYYSDCEALGTGKFGTLDDEKASYEKWGWTFESEKVPKNTQPLPDAFVAREDNHYESEADSTQGLLLMYLRTGQRGWFDLAEAWARYHTDLQAWRTDGWRWKDGAIWFPQGGPQGNRRVREDWNFAWGANWGERKNSLDCADLWTHSQSKSCYCHYYGSGLADYFCLTGDRDALAAAIDDVDQKDSEFRRSQQLKPGESTIGSIRGFGRGFEVMVRVLLADPGNEYVRELCRLCAETLWQSPLLDERGFHCSSIGGGWAGMKAKDISPNVRKWMEGRGISFTTEGDTVDTLTKGDRTWPVRCFGGTWQHYYVQSGAELYGRQFDDENMQDFTIAFAQMTARYMLSPKCHQTWYYTYFDVPDLGMVFDPWAFDHTDTQDGEGCVHSGYYTRFFPDACAKGYSLTGERHLLDKGREFWYYGSKRTYQSKGLKGGRNEVWQFASHRPPKDDSVLEVSRLFYEASHTRADELAPAPVADLKVKILGDGKAEIQFVAPADAGGGTVVRYQVKAADLPIVPYEQWDFARDIGQRRNWWRAVNCQGEPSPSKPGSEQRFVVTGVPQGETVYFAVRSFDDSNNRSKISNVVAVKPE